MLHQPEPRISDASNDETEKIVMHAGRNLSEVNGFSLKYVPVNGALLSYVERGNGEPIVFVHGELGDLRTWLREVETFSHKYRAISYSRREHWPGERVVEKGEYLRDTHAADLIALIDALELNKVHLVGHSFGAAVALLAALEAPDRIISLTLGEPSPFPNMFEESEFQALLRRRLGLEEAFLLAKRKNPEAAVRQFLTVMVGADVLDQIPSSSRESMLDNASTLPRIIEHYFESPSPSRARLKRLETPCLLISGEFSPKLSFMVNQKLSRRLPNSQDVTLSSTSHGLHIENPDGFNQIVDNFLAGLQPQSSKEWSIQHE
jgi:pimeloyl-ACP methyl ester carboxylesterase